MLARLCMVAMVATWVSATLVNEKVSRSLDLTTHLVKETVEVTVKNTGSSSVSSYLLSFGELKPSFVSVTDSKHKDLVVNGNSVSVEIGAGKTVDLIVSASYAHALVPFPEEIRQDEVQLVKYSGNLYFSSPYDTKTQTTTLKAAGAAQSYTKTKPFKTSGDKSVVYGPYENVAANAASELSYHFESKSPFLTVTNIVREIEVSHWGNVAITEDITMKHTGAKLKGAFSRLDFQRNPASSRNAIKTFETALPAAARDVYYRDVIGNVSTSNLREDDEAVTLLIRPRFPLFGGWKTQYTLGYNLPSYEVLSNDGSQFSLNIRFVDHIYDDMVIDSAEVRIVLPEGASNIQVKTPFATERLADGVRLTYLDTTGRPVVTLRKSNLVEQHMQEFELTYEFAQVTLLREPLMLVAFFAVLLFSAIIINRVDMTIVSDKAAKVKQQ